MLTRNLGLSLLAVLCATAAAAQQPALEPLGISLEGYPYPHPVQFLPLTLEGQDVRMAYMDVKPTAKANGRTLLLLHGKNFFGGYWASTIQVLTARGFRVVVPDQLGFGKSSKPAIHYSFHTLAATTKQLLDALGVKEVAVVGHSMGGMLATRFARMFPDATTHLVLENPIGLEDYRLLVPWQSTEELYREQLQATAEGIRQYHGTYYSTWRPEYDEYVRVPARQLLSADYPRLAWVSAATTQMIYEQPVVYEFPLVNRPTLVVIGQLDRTSLGRGKVSPEVQEKLGRYMELGGKTAAAFPRGTLVPLRGVGHIPHLEAPDRFHSALSSFLEK